MFRAVGLRTHFQQEITARRRYPLARTASAKLAFVLLQNDSLSASFRRDGLGRDALSAQQNHSEQLDRMGHRRLSLGRRLYAEALDAGSAYACQSCEVFLWVLGNAEATQKRYRGANRSDHYPFSAEVFS